MASMDTDMVDVEYDIQLDAEPIEAFQTQEPTLVTQQPQPNDGDNKDVEMPAAYFESLETVMPVPEWLNLQGVDDFGPNAPMDFALEHCPEPRPRRLRWVNDTSVNLEYDTIRDAADALLALTHPDVADAASIPAQTSRKAKTYSANPGSDLKIREANTGDQKAKNASRRNDYSRNNAQNRDRERDRPRRRPEPPAVYLDYDGEGEKNGKSPEFNESMYDDAPVSRDNGAARGRHGNDQPRGRQNRDVDSYRPRSNSARESRFGRLRGRSASPLSDGDGRYGFAEESASNRRPRSRSRGDRRRRSRSRSRDRDLRKRITTTDNSRWGEDRAITLDGSGRWAKNTTHHAHKADMGNHRRSDAMDETKNKGSLLSRMTKDGRPVAPTAETRSLASRITRDEPDSGRPKFASRISRDDSQSNYGRPSNRSFRNDPDPNYGRLKDDDSAPREDSFQEPVATRNDLASRMTWSRDRGGDKEVGFNIRGAAPQGGGFSIRGAAGGN